MLTYPDDLEIQEHSYTKGTLRHSLRDIREKREEISRFMSKLTVKIIRFFSSSSLMVAIGMTILILGGAAGSCLLWDKIPNPALAHSVFVEPSPSGPSAHQVQLVQEIHALQGETRAMLHTDGYALVGYAEKAKAAHNTISSRRDPFAPIAPPSDLNAETADAADNASAESGKATVPGDTLSSASEQTSDLSGTAGIMLAYRNSPSRKTPS